MEKVLKEYWRGAASMPSGAAVMADWRWSFGGAVELIVPFLRATAQQAESYPCTGHPRCDCRHNLVEEDEGWVSVCSQPEECFCERDCVELKPEDVVMYRLDRRGFGEAAGRALGFGEVCAAGYSSTWLEEVGSFGVAGNGGMRVPVYFSMARGSLLARELAGLKGVRDGPLVLLTPAADACGCEVESWLEREGGSHIGLELVLEPEADGAFRSGTMAGGILQTCARRLGKALPLGAAGAVAGPVAAVAAKPRYLLRKGLQGWQLVFDGKETVLWDEKAVSYVAVLLLAPPPEPIHGTELAHRAFGDAVVEDQRNLAMDDADTAREMAGARAHCQAVIDDEGASEVEREEARAELEEIQDWARKHVRGTEGNEQRQVRAIRQSIGRLLEKLLAAREADGRPNEVLRAFGEHLKRYLWGPSGRARHGRNARVRAGLAGRFTYEPPSGVKWCG